MRTATRQLWIVAMLAMLVLGSTVMHAVTEDTVIRACVENGNALFRFVELGEDCRKNERAISWGMKGPQGEPGPAGKDGAPGLSGVEMVSGTAMKLPTGVLAPNVTVNATCPAGKVALSGGATLSRSGAFVVLGSPVVAAGQSAPTGWSSYVTLASGGALPGAANIVATAYAICAFAQ